MMRFEDKMLHVSDEVLLSSSKFKFIAQFVHFANSAHFSSSFASAAELA